jgi:hypothetical protein
LKKKSERILHKFSEIFFFYNDKKQIAKKVCLFFLFGNNNYIYLKLSNHNQYIDQIFKEIYLLN